MEVQPNEYDIDSEQQSRLLGRVKGKSSGPTFVIVGGVHGNEAAGVVALRNVLNDLASMTDLLCGEVLGLVGNVGALKLGVRFRDRDLNRMWMVENIIQSEQEAGEAELTELRELNEVLTGISRNSNEDLYLMDLHTTSSDSVPFLIIDPETGKSPVGKLPVPKVFNVENQINGTLMGYGMTLGYRCINFEAGHHFFPSSVDRHTAAIWLELHYVGCLPGDAFDMAGMKELLTVAARGLPLQYFSRFHYFLKEGEGFKMRPGYENFQTVGKEEHIADNATGPILCPLSGRVFMPLYQDLGEDGFFIIEEIPA